MRKRKPELTCVKTILWDPVWKIYGLETIFDDGVVIREPWGSYQETFRMMEIRSKDIRASSMHPPKQ
jgi:hypothetical protein